MQVNILEDCERGLSARELLWDLRDEERNHDIRIVEGQPNG